MSTNIENVTTPSTQPAAPSASPPPVAAPPSTPAPPPSPVGTPSPVATPSPLSAPPPPIGAAVVAQCSALADQVAAAIGPVTPLTRAMTLRSLKLRKGGAQVVTQLLALCTQHGIGTVGPVSVQAMTGELARANALNQIGVQLDAVRKKVSDAAFSAESVTWQCATTLYTVLQRIALIDPTLAAGLQPVQAFFQTSKTKGKKTATRVVSKAKKAVKVAAKHVSPTPSAAPAASPAAPAGAAAPAPAAASPSTPNGGAHAP